MSTPFSTSPMTRTNEDLFRRVIDEGFTQGHLDVLDEVIAPDCIEHQPGLSPGPDGVKGAIRFLHGVFPDFTLVIEDLVVDGDKVWGRLRANGTHKGTLMGHPGTGKTMGVTVFDVCRFENGKMVEHWGVPDRFTQMEQLGLLPGLPGER